MNLQVDCIQLRENLTASCYKFKSRANNLVKFELGGIRLKHTGSPLTDVGKSRRNSLFF